MTPGLPLYAAPRLTLRKVKVFRGMDGSGLNANLYLDGKYVAFILDEGNGSGMYIHYDDQAMSTIVDAYIASLDIPGTPWTLNETALMLPWTLDTLINRTIDDHEDAKRMARLRKTKILFRLPTDDSDTIRTIQHKDRVAEATAWLLRKYPEARILT